MTDGHTLPLNLDAIDEKARAGRYIELEPKAWLSVTESIQKLKLTLAAAEGYRPSILARLTNHWVSATSLASICGIEWRDLDTFKADLTYLLNTKQLDFVFHDQPLYRRRSG